MAGRKRTFPISVPILREIAEDCQQRNPVLQIILTCVALIRAQAALDSVKLEGDAKIGVEIIRRACEAPLRQLTENAGVDGSIVVRQIPGSVPLNSPVPPFAPFLQTLSIRFCPSPRLE